MPREDYGLASVLISEPRKNLTAQQEPKHEKHETRNIKTNDEYVWRRALWMAHYFVTQFITHTCTKKRPLASKDSCTKKTSWPPKSKLLQFRSFSRKSNKPCSRMIQILSWDFFQHCQYHWYFRPIPSVKHIHLEDPDSPASTAVFFISFTSAEVSIKSLTVCVTSLFGWCS